MISRGQPIPWVVLYEGPPAQSFSATVRTTLMSAFLQRGIATRVRKSRDDGPSPGERSTIVLGQFGGEVPETLAALAGPAGQVCDVTKLECDAVVELVEQLCFPSAQENGPHWKPWFPVIDYDRCTNCMQCLSFCLFDVYGVTSEGKITVQNQSNCKTDCPACSRVCPEVAILFPKYKAGPINGDEVSEDDIRREAMKVDISALLGGDVYALLRDRSAKAKSRFSRERDDDRALKERQRCLKKLQSSSGLEIPADVLANLPSLDEIQRKAAEAKQRAEDALEATANPLLSDGEPAG